MEPMVVFKGIKKSFPGTKALDFKDDDVINVYPGEIHGLVGENGAGKSTLLQVLMGIYQKDGGEIHVAGRPYEARSAIEAEYKGISIIMQQSNILTNLTVAENIFIGRDNEFRNKAGLVLWKKQNQKAAEVLADLGYDIAPNALLRDLSFERRKEVEIARAISVNPKVLLVDETSAAVSKESVESLYKLLFKLKEKGIAIIYISHFINEIFELCDTATVLRDGKLIGTFTVKDSTPEEIVSKMVGREVQGTYREDDSTGDISEALVEVRNLSMKGHFEDVNFVIHRGEIVGLGGIGGCGIEEIGSALFGRKPYTSGEIVFGGKPVKISNPIEAMRLGIGYIPKDRDREGLVLRFTLRENVSSANLRKLQRKGFLKLKDEKKITDDQIKQLKIKTNSPETITMNLSGGNRQKVAFAKWISNDSTFLIINSPTRGVDVGAKFEIYKEIEALKKKGKAILVITDELPELIGLSDNIYTVKKGRITAHINRDEVVTEEKVITHMT